MVAVYILHHNVERLIGMGSGPLPAFATRFGEAMRLIRHGYADAAITGGAEAAIIPSAIAGFANMKALSVAENPEEASLPFDKRRGGFVMGEGAAALVL